MLPQGTEGWTVHSKFRRVLQRRKTPGWDWRGSVPRGDLVDERGNPKTPESSVKRILLERLVRTLMMINEDINDQVYGRKG